MNDIIRYIYESSSNHFNRNDIDNKMFKFDVSNRAFIVLNDDYNTLDIGNRAFFSIAYDRSDLILSLPNEYNGELFDVFVLSGGIYVKNKNVSEFMSIPEDKSSFIINNELFGYQGDGAIILIYVDKITKEIVALNKIFLTDNTNAQMGNGEFKTTPQFMNSSCQVILDDTRSVVLSCGGLSLDSTINPDVSSEIKITTALDLSIDMSSIELSNSVYILNTDTSEFVEYEPYYKPDPRFGHGTIKLQDNIVIIGGALDKTLIDFSNIPILDNCIITETLINLEYFQEAPDVTISSGNFGMEEIITGKEEGWDFGDSSTSGEDGYYVLLPFTSSDETVLVQGQQTMSPMSTGRYDFGSFGDNLYTLVFGGRYYPWETLNSCEKFSIKIWATASSLNNTRELMAGCGNTSNGLCIGGSLSGSPTANVDRQNGSTWATTASLTISRQNLAASGSYTSAICFGGICYDPEDGQIYPTVTEKYNGSVQVTTSSLNASRSILSGCGSSDGNSALCFGGDPSGTEIYNGTVQATTTNLNVERMYVAGCGVTSGALCCGGYEIAGYNNSHVTEMQNGTSQATTSAMNYGKQNLGGSGTKETALVYGGKSSSYGSPSMEKYFETETNIATGDNVQQLCIEVRGGGVGEYYVNYPGDITSIDHKSPITFPLLIDVSEKSVFGEICLYLRLPDGTKISYIGVKMIPSLY